MLESVKKHLLAATTFAVLLTGCVTHVERYDAQSEQLRPAAQPETKAKPVTDKRVIIDRSLNHIVRLVKITSTTSRDGYLKIQLNIQNMTDNFQKFSYRIDWLDDQGLPMAETDPMEWTLLRGKTSFLAATSPTPAAKSFRVMFARN